jgi:putative hemolysin
MIVTVLTILGVVALLIGTTALYVMGEFASVSSRKTRIIHMAAEGNALAKALLPILEDPHKLDNYIAASQVGITLSSIGLGIYGEQQIAPHIAPLLERLPLGGMSEAGTAAAAEGISAVLVLLVLTTLAMVMGELVPKSLAIQHPERWALVTALPMRWSADIIFKPLILLLNGSGVLILKLLGLGYDHEHTHVHSPEEIMILVKEAHRGGLLDADERRLLANLFRASETRAEDIAVPRTRMVAADVDEPLEAVLRLAAESAYTRIPVYERDIDHIIGFVHLRELFNLYQGDRDGGVRGILRPIPFVPETLPMIEVWNRLNETQSYLAIVFDEFGGTSGLITREDLLEELFGEVQDEFDRERALIRSVGDRRIVVRGDMSITMLNDLLNLHLPHDTSHSIGGLMTEELGRVPSVGDVVEIDKVRFRVEAVAHNSVNAVSMSLPPGVSAPMLEEIEGTGEGGDSE